MMARVFTEMVASFAHEIADFDSASTENLVQALGLVDPPYIKNKLVKYYLPTIKDQAEKLKISNATRVYEFSKTSHMLDCLSK